MIITTLTHGEIIEQMDRFYADAANVRIPVNYAYSVIGERVRGTKEDLLQRHIERLRRAAAARK